MSDETQCSGEPSCARLCSLSYESVRSMVAGNWTIGRIDASAAYLICSFNFSCLVIFAQSPLIHLHMCLCRVGYE